MRRLDKHATDGERREGRVSLSRVRARSWSASPPQGSSSGATEDSGKTFVTLHYHF
jgi:hypothetical protein